MSKYVPQFSSNLFITTPQKILATDKSNYKKMSTGATTEKHTKKLKI